MADLHQILKKSIVLSPNPGLRQELKKDLQVLKIDVIKTAGQVKTISDMLEEEPATIDLVLADLNLDDAKEEEVELMLRKIPSCVHAHLILMVDHDQLQVLEPLLKIGATGFLVKPFKPKMVQKSILNLFTYYQVFHKDRETLNLLSQARYFELVHQHFAAAGALGKINQKFEVPGLLYDEGRMHNKSQDREKSLAAFKKALALQPQLGPKIKKFLADNPLKAPEKKVEIIPPKALELCFVPDAELASSKSYYSMERINSVAIYEPDLVESRQIQQMIKPLGFKVVELYSGQEDLCDALSKRPFDLLIYNTKSELDEVLEEFKVITKSQHNSRLRKLAMMASYGDEARLKELFTAGVDWLIIHPLTTSNIRFGIHNLNLQEDLCCMSEEGTQLVKAAYCQIQLGNYELAAGIAKKAWSLNPMDGVCLAYLALSLGEVGQKDKSEQYFENAIQNNPRLKPFIARIREMYKTKKAS